MEILVVRHAQAEPLGRGLARADADRALTIPGREAFRAAAGAVRGLGVRPARILASPRMRAVQTAEILAAETGFARAVESCPDLARAGGWRPLLAELGAHPAPPDGPLALVGHNPDLTELVTELLGGRGGAMALPPGALCLLTRVRPDRPARLAWWIDPADGGIRQRP